LWHLANVIFEVRKKTIMSRTFGNVRAADVEVVTHKIVGDGSDHTASTTGALRVEGGLGAIGKSFFGGDVEVEAAAVTKLAHVDVSTSVDSGALQVAGGIGVAKDSYFGAKLKVDGDTEITGVLDVNSLGIFRNQLTVESGTTTLKGESILMGGVVSTLPTPATDGTDGSMVLVGGLSTNESNYFADDTEAAADATTAALVVAGGIGVQKKSVFSDPTEATNSATAALVVSGGIGVAKDSVFDGIVTLENTQGATVDSNGALTAAALMVKGGIGVAEHSYFEKDVIVQDFLFVESTDEAYESGSGAIQTKGGISTLKTNFFADVTPASVDINDDLTAALMVKGGIGVEAKSIFSDATAALNATTAALVVTGGIGVGDNSVFGADLTVEQKMFVTGDAKLDGYVNMEKDEAATGVNTGSLQVLGGISTSKQNYFGNVNAAALDSSNNLTAALVVAGGIGVKQQSYFLEDVNFQKNLRVEGDLNVKGTLTSVENQSVNIGDSFLNLNAQNTASGQEAGFVFNYDAIAFEFTGSELSDIDNKITVGGAGFTQADAGSFIQIHNATDATHNGIYEVASKTDDNNFTVKDVGQQNFCLAGNVFSALSVADTAITASHIKVGLLKFDTYGKLAYANADNGENILWKYPSASSGRAMITGSPYEEIDVNHSTRQITATTSNVTSTGDVILPTNQEDNPGGTKNGNSYFIQNSWSEAIDVTCPSGDYLDGVLNGTFNLAPGDRANFRGVAHEWFTF
jgi:hypothetical protein